MESLSDKLKSLGVHLGTEHIAPPGPRKKIARIEDVLPGYEDQTPFGSTFIVQEDYPDQYVHGAIRLCSDLSPGILTEWSKSKRLHPNGDNRLIFLDTETSGLAGGTGTFAFMVGLGFRTAAGFRLVQLFLRDPSYEPAMLASLQRFLDGYDAIVTYNGKSFDIPLLNTRHILNGFSSPFGAMDHLDLLHLARRMWRSRLPSRTLKDLENEILSVSRSQEEVPGWMVPEIYYEYLRDGNAAPLAGVFYHNAVDILTLAALYNHFCLLLNDPLQEDQVHSLDLIAIGRLYEELGHFERAIGLYESGLNAGLPRPFYLQTLQRYALIYRKQGRWEEAVQLWQKAAEFEQIDACIELAKYYEHQQRDDDTALLWTQRAIGYLSRPALPPGSSTGLLKTELEHRQKRLNMRLGKV
ncbi:MAG: tetratricopeptide repeat protein [Chloroflexi bacterium]|nr:tetratricopeptide repeat protein [Chloroflexota bacterium]